MAFGYNVGPSTPATVLTTNATPNTESPNLAVRQAVRGFDMASLTAVGRASALAAITGISLIVRRWTTVGSGGTAITPAPHRIGTVASTTAADSQSALTAGTVSGAIVAGLGMGAGGPGYWNAINQDAMVQVEAGSADELAVMSLCGVASQGFQIPVCTIFE